jgi:hypothetical protein
MVRNYKELIGKTFVSVENRDDDEMIFTVNEDEQYKFFHSQDCCESVWIEDIEGDLNDLVGTPLLKAEEVCEYPKLKHSYGDTQTWTFYKFATAKGHVTVRWIGQSNGYYSESVNFCKVGEDYDRWY